MVYATFKEDSLKTLSSMSIIELIQSIITEIGEPMGSLRDKLGFMSS